VKTDLTGCTPAVAKGILTEKDSAESKKVTAAPVSSPFCLSFCTRPAESVEKKGTAEEITESFLSEYVTGERK